jgi:Reverse transcriptase (RNA-dependent DNA polymerase)
LVEGTTQKEQSACAACRKEIKTRGTICCLCGGRIHTWCTCCCVTRGHEENRNGEEADGETERENTQQKVQRRRIPGTNKRIKSRGIVDNANDENEEPMRTKPSYKTHTTGKTEVVFDETFVSDLQKRVCCERPSVWHNIPQQCHEVWTQTLEKIAKRAAETESLFERQSYSILFVSAPFFILDKRRCPTETDIQNTLLVYYDQIEHYFLTPEEKRIPEGEYADLTEEQRKIKRATALIQVDNCSKALKILTEEGKFAERNVVERLKSKVVWKEGEDQIELPEKNRTTCVYTKQQITKVIRKMKNGKTPSCGMMKGEHLKPFAYAENEYPFAWQFICCVVNSISCGDLPSHLQPVILQDFMKGMEKRDGGIRPIAMSNTWCKIAAQLLLANVKKERIVGKHQYGYGKKNGTKEAAQKVQQYINEGKVVLKTDVSNAFGSVPRPQLSKMLFDSPQTKTLWRYFFLRYGRKSTFHVFSNKYEGEIETNVGINQGDPLSLLFFDFYLSDISVENAELILIHDDVYAVTTPQHVCDVFEKLHQYLQKKGLTANKEKTTILSKQNVTLPVGVEKLREKGHTKIGGGIVHPELQEMVNINEWNYNRPLSKIPHQHSYRVLLKCIIPKWKYVIEATHPQIIRPLTSSILEWQVCWVKNILKTTKSDTVPFASSQLFFPCSEGGMGLFNPGEMNEESGGEANGEWKNETTTAFAENLKSEYPIISVAPLHKFLRLNNEEYSAFVAALLGTWTPFDFFCRLKGEKLIFPVHRKGSLSFISHNLCCVSCASGLKTFRHDSVNEAFGFSLRSNGIPYLLEPKGWPLRNKESNSGRDGPDGLILFQQNTMWVDFSFVYQNPFETHNMVSRAHSYKIREYKSAAEANISVEPVVFSCFGSAHPSTKNLFERIKQQRGKKAVREIRNVINVKLAKSFLLFKQHAEMKNFTAHTPALPLP